ncbi:MAG TPA: class I SAM-dependent methyltransferase [Terriglobales bacterium]
MSGNLPGRSTAYMDYQDRRIAEIYDVANPLAEDSRFYFALAGEQPSSVLDLGCGTGTLCCGLAERGHQVTGVDPAAAMLDVARGKPHADHIEWVEATAQSYRSERRFDLIVMTGHAFQCLLSDADILAGLETMRLHLRDEGRIAFETRNPRVDWAGEWTGRQRSLLMPSGAELAETLEVTGKDGEFISFRTAYVFPHMTLSTSSTLRFSSREHVEGLIHHAGLLVCDVLGDWEAGGFDPARSREMIFVGERAG